MATLYWYGGSGNWTDYTNHWSNNSGNSPASPAAAAPTSADDAIFDANSGTGTVTINSTANCKNLDFSASTILTLAGGSTINIYGNLTFKAGMTDNHSGQKYLKQTSGTVTITTNAVEINYWLVMDAAATTFVLADDLTFKGSNCRLSRNNGTFNHNNKTIKFKGSGGCIYNIASVYNLTIEGSNTLGFYFFTFSNIAVTNLLTVTGYSVTRPVLLTTNSSSGGSRYTWTCGSVALTYVNFRDIGGAGTAAPFTGTSLGDCLNNTGITFDTPLTLYWRTNAGSWSDSSKWKLNDGSAGRVPLPQDSVVFDGSSFDTGSQTVSADMNYLGKNFTLATVTNTPTINLPNDIKLMGGFIGGTANITGNYNFTFDSNTTINITSSGIYFNVSYINFSRYGGRYTLTDYFYSAGYVSQNGPWVTAQGNVTVKAWAAVNSFSRVYMGSGTWEMTGSYAYSSYGFVLTFGAILDAGTSTLKLTATTDSDAKAFGTNNNAYSATFNIVEISADKVTITGTLTIADLRLNTAGKATGTLVTSGAVLTVGLFSTNGSVGSLARFLAVTAGSYFTINKTSGEVVEDYLYLKDSHAGGGAGWYAGSHSTNVSGNTGWKFFDATLVTVTAKARIKKLGGLKTVTAKADIFNTAIKTVTAKTKIVSRVTKTVTAKADIKVPDQEVTITAKARIKQEAVETSIEAKARIKSSGTVQTIQSKARIIKEWTKTVTAKARIKIPDNLVTATAKARIVARSETSISAKARIKVLDNLKTLTAKARIRGTGIVKTATAKARIKTIDITKTLTGKARIKILDVLNTISAKSRILTHNLTTVEGRARIKRTFDTTIQAKARIKRLAALQTVSAKSRVKTTGEIQEISAKARIKQLDNLKTVVAKARIKIIDNLKTVSAKARILHYQSTFITAKARIKGTGNLNTITAKARIKAPGYLKTISAKARIANRIIATITAMALIVARRKWYVERPAPFKTGDPKNWYTKTPTPFKTKNPGN